MVKRVSPPRRYSGSGVHSNFLIGAEELKMSLLNALADVQDDTAWRAGRLDVSADSSHCSAHRNLFDSATSIALVE